MTTCPVCGAEVQPNQRFCSQCGSRLTSASGSEERNAVPRRPGGGKPDPYGVGGADDDDFFSHFRPKSAVSDDEQAPKPASSRRRFNPMFTGEQDLHSAEAEEAERVAQSERRSAAQKAEAERRARRRAETERADAQRRQAEEARKAAAARAAERAEYARLEAERAAQAERDAEAKAARAAEEERRALDQDPEPAANDMPALPSPFGHFTKRSAPSIPSKDWSDEDAPPTARMSADELRSEISASTPTVDEEDREVEIPSWFSELTEDEAADDAVRDAEADVPVRPARKPFSGGGAAGAGSGAAAGLGAAGAAGAGVAGAAAGAADAEVAVNGGDQTGGAADREAWVGADDSGASGSAEHDDDQADAGTSRGAPNDGATFTQLIEGLDNDPADAPISSPGVGDTGVVPLPTEHLSAEEQARHDRAAALFGGAVAAGAAVAGAASVDDDAAEATVLGGHERDAAGAEIDAEGARPAGLDGDDADIFASTDEQPTVERANGLGGANPDGRVSAADDRPDEVDEAHDSGSVNEAEQPTNADPWQRPSSDADLTAEHNESANAEPFDSSDDDLDRFFAQAGLGDAVRSNDAPIDDEPADAAPRSTVGGWFSKLSDRTGLRGRGDGEVADASANDEAAYRDDDHDDELGLFAGGAAAATAGAGSRASAARDADASGATRNDASDGARGNAAADTDASTPTRGNWFSKLTAAGAGGVGADSAAEAAPAADDDETRRHGVRTIAIAAAAAVVLILGTFLTVNIFGKHEDAPVAESPIASQPSETAAQPQPTETPTQQAPATFEPTSFASESGNIRCQITSESGVACQMTDRDFSLPEQECVGPNYSGIAIGVNADGVTWPCLSSDLSADRAVAYDEPVKAGEFTCVINFETGVTCSNGKGDGFTMEYENGVQTKGAVIASPNVDVTVN